MSSFTVIANKRSETGSSASRRLRRAGLVPGVVYGGTVAPDSITIIAKDLIKMLEDESFFTAVVTLDIDGAQQQAVIMDLQRHPFKPTLLHVDFERVTADTIVTKLVPLHFINEATSNAVKNQGASIQHVAAEVEMKCPAGVLPEFIEVDLANAETGQVIHLSDLVIPAGAQLVELAKGAGHDSAVATVVAPKGAATDAAE